MAGGDFLARIKLALEGKEKVITGLREVQGTAQKLTQTKITTIFDKEGVATGRQISDTFKTISDEGGKSTAKMGDFEKALRRVIIVAPVWMAFRTVVMSFFKGISEGIRYYEEFDRALMKSKAVIQGYTGDLNVALKDLEGRIRNLSQETGESMTKIAQSFYAFGETGMAFEESWRGAETAVRYAMATMGDATQIASTMARTFLLLSGTIDKTIPETERETVTLAKMYKLWQINAYEANEYTESLKAFLPTANTMGLTLDQTTALLATLNSASLQASRGGTLLRTSFAKLLDNISDLAKTLGIYVNPEVDTTFDLFMKVLGVIKQLGTGGISIRAQEAISSIFGGVRGGEPVRALLALYDKLQENLSITGQKYSELGQTMEDYKARLEDINNSASRQIQIFRELRTQVFEQFVVGVTGGEDFVTALTKANEGMKALGDSAKGFGGIINSIFLDMEAPLIARITGINAFVKSIKSSVKETEDLIAAIDKARAGEMTVAEIFETIGKMKAQKGTMADKEFWKMYADELQGIAENIIDYEQSYARVSKVINNYNEKFIVQKNKQVEQDNNLLRLLQLKRKESINELETIRMQSEGYSESDIELSKLKESVSKLVEDYNSLDAVIAGTIPKLGKQEVLTSLLNDNWKKILDTSKGNIFTEEEMIKLVAQRNKLESVTLQQQLKQKDAIRDMYMMYEKADAFERDRIKRLMELMTMSSRELAMAFESNVYDKAIIEEYWSSFSESAREAINEVIARMYPELARITAGIGAKMPAMGIGIGGLPTAAPTPITATATLAANFGNIIIELPPDALPGIVAKAGEELTNKLQTDEDFKKFVASAIRPYV